MPAGSKSAAASARVLYISYDGLTDPLGQSQILPYLVGCARRGHRITVISFEKPERYLQLGEQVHKSCQENQIDWRPQRFRTFPPLLAKWFDLRVMSHVAMHIAAEKPSFDLVHARSYQPATIGLKLKRKFGLKLLFDMRGFWPDSRREGGRWARGVTGPIFYRKWKRHEARIIEQSDHIVTVAAAAKTVVERWNAYRGAPVSVIPCCADFEVYKPSGSSARRQLGIDLAAPVLLYVGSLGTIYRLRDQLRLFAKIRERAVTARMLFIGTENREQIVSTAAQSGIALTEDEFRTISVDRTQIARFISAGDVGTCFYTPTFSSLGVSPTKLGEYLACGIPAIGNLGVGDVAKILAATQGGFLMPDFSDDSLEGAADAFFRLKTIDGHALRERARPILDLPIACAAYHEVYRQMVGPPQSVS